MDLKERAEVMAKQEEAMRVSFNLERKVIQCQNRKKLH